MASKRIFTDKELEEMGTRTLDLVLEAIEAGDKERAKNLAERMYKEFNFLHDGYMFWVTGLLTHIYKNYGIDAVEKAGYRALVYDPESGVDQEKALREREIRTQKLRLGLSVLLAIPLLVITMTGDSRRSESPVTRIQKCCGKPSHRIAFHSIGKKCL